ncbi:MAG: preprotein translocase subunit SecE [Ruminococcus sp.]|nr:preprotein translocase subunit SecE [Ruminococcus sp.]
MAKEKENTTPEKKSKKSEKKKPNRVAKWFKDLKSEFKKVVWPTRKTVVNNTAVVVAVVAVAAILVGALDAGFLKIMDLIYNH